MSKKHSNGKKSKRADKNASSAVDDVLNLANGNAASAPTAIAHEDYEAQLHLLQVELVKLQRHFIKCGDRILVLVEGRDAAGKDDSIKRIAEHLSPRDTRVVALGKPSDRDRHGWYFQRYVAHLPVAEELVLFNRSWYNRAGVEQVMGFCSKDEHEEFMNSVPRFEEMLVSSGIRLLKYYLDISKTEQVQRLADRKRDPLKQWKVSPVDAVAVKLECVLRSTRRDVAAHAHGDCALAHRAYGQQAAGATESDARHPVPPPLRRQETKARAGRPEHRIRIHARLPEGRAPRALTS